ncbi:MULTISPECIES: hypothetical protein [Lentzea]|uniref:hypothetical protein n=1 Tax=Lentzea TaxID=165301 RepID=UPI0011B538CD|nr:hypothetical protein [Lentzea atacamensis]
MTSRIVAEIMLMKILAPVDAPRLAALGRRAEGLGRGRAAGAADFALAGVVRTVGRSATGRGRGADDVARAGSRPRGDSLRLADARRGGSLRGGSLRGGSERFGGSRRGGSARFDCRRGGSELRGGTWGRRG